VSVCRRRRNRRRVAHRCGRRAAASRRSRNCRRKCTAQRACRRAWWICRVAFRPTPLRQRRAARRRRGREPVCAQPIVIADAQLESLRVTTSFRTSQVEGMIETLQAVLPLGCRAQAGGRSCCARARSRRGVACAWRFELSSLPSQRLVVPLVRRARPRPRKHREFPDRGTAVVAGPAGSSRGSRSDRHGAGELVGDKRRRRFAASSRHPAALSQLLRGSGLEASFTASGAVTIDKARRVARQRTRTRVVCGERSRSSRRCAHRGSAGHCAEANRERAGRALLRSASSTARASVNCTLRRSSTTPHTSPA
jgi:hypothetical protein